MPTHRMRQRRDEWGTQDSGDGRERSRVRAMPTHRIRQRRDEWAPSVVTLALHPFIAGWRCWGGAGRCGIATRRGRWCGRSAGGVDGDGDGHIFYLELVDGFHAEVGEGEDARRLDGLGDEVGRAADGDEVDGVELADGGDGFRPALGLADGAEQTGAGRAPGG